MFFYFVLCYELLLYKLGQDLNVTVITESAVKWSLERKENLLVAKLMEELHELFDEFLKGDPNKAASEAGDVLDVINAIEYHVQETRPGGRSIYSPQTGDLITRARHFIDYVNRYLNNLHFNEWVKSSRREKKRSKDLFKKLLIVRSEHSNPS